MQAGGRPGQLVPEPGPIERRLEPRGIQRLQEPVPLLHRHTLREIAERHYAARRRRELEALALRELIRQLDQTRRQLVGIRQPATPVFHVRGKGAVLYRAAIRILKGSAIAAYGCNIADWT